MEKVYQWKDGSRFKLPAPVAGKEIDRIRVARGGFFTPKDIWVENREPGTPIYPEFEADFKDIQGSAENYWTVKAREMTRHINVVIVPNKDEQKLPCEPIRAFVSYQTPEKQNVYMDAVVAMTTPPFRESTLDMALRDIRALERRYSALLDFAGIMREFHAAIEKARQDHPDD
jgi:hypothetical protein